MATSIFSRKMDLVYLIYFMTHIPVMFLMDLQTIYPASITPKFLTSIKEFYIETYHDQFFVSPPIYFQLFIWLELAVHVPVSFWAVGALLKDKPTTPLILILYSLEVFLTTMVCIYEYLHWPVSSAQKWNLTTLYGPYILLSLVMFIDMFGRLHSLVSRQAKGRNAAVAKKRA